MGDGPIKSIISYVNTSILESVRAKIVNDKSFLREYGKIDEIQVSLTHGNSAVVIKGSNRVRVRSLERKFDGINQSG